MADILQGALVTVLVVHRDDEDATAIVDLLEEHVAHGDAVEHLTIAVDAATGSDAALWRAHRAGAESSDDPLLFERLADIGRIERLRMVAVTSRSDVATCTDLDRAMLALTSTAARLLGADRQRTHARIAVVGYGEPMPPATFFSTLADVNAAVLPYDRLEDASIARPVERAATDLFRTHGAVEVASACGLWRTMASAPIDGFRGGGTSGSVPRVCFLQSRVRLLRTPPLPVAELVAERREVPVPDGHLPAADAERLMPRLAALLVPPELTYEPAPDPRYESQRIAPGVLARMLGREIGASFLDLPGLIWRSVGGEVSTLTRRVLQQAIGESSRYRVIDDVDGGVGGLRDADGRPVDIDTVVAEPEVLAHFDPIPGEIWTTLVAEVLGSIDGDPDCRDLREQAFGDARFLPVERPLLLGGLAALPPRLVALLEPRREHAPIDLEEVAAADPADPATTADAEDAGVPDLPPTAQEMEDDEPPAEPPPLVGFLAEEREVGEAIVREWRRITDVAGALWTGARATYRAMQPVAYVGGILTLQVKPTTSSPEFHMKRAISPNFIDALTRALPEVLDQEVRVLAIETIETLEGWEPLLHDVMLGELLGVDATSGGLDDLMARAALLEVPQYAPALRHEALGAADLDTLSAFVATDAQAQFLRDYAAALRAIAGAPPALDEPPSGAPISGLAPPPAADGLAAPSGLPFLDIPPPEDDEELDEDWDLDLDPDAVDPLAGEWGLLVGIRDGIRRQREAAERDVERILDQLRGAKGSGGAQRTAVSPAVPVGAGIGLMLLLIWLGQTPLGIRAVSSLGLDEVRRDMLFTVMTLLLVIGAATLTDLGKGLSGQARAIVLVGTSVLVTSAVLLSFGTLRGLVPLGLRESNVVAFSLGFLAFALVLIALLQSVASDDPVRIQGSRILTVGVVLYAVTGIIVWQVQSRAGLIALGETTSSRLGGVLLSTGLGLLFAAVAVLAVVRFREARRRDDAGVRDRWAVGHIGLAVDARERLRAAERQWVASMIAIAQVLRQPFGPVREVTEEPVETGTAATQVALKAASVRVRLTDRGRSDLEARIRQMLVGPSWLRRRYQAMVDAHHRILATRLGMPVRNLAERRPEADPTVPSELDLRAARGRGDRMEFIRLAAAGTFDASLAQVIEELDVRTVFEPMLAEPESHVLDGFESRADTVERYFQQILPESEPTLPNDIVTTVLAAHDRRRHLRSFLWWPSLLPEPSSPLDAEDRPTVASTGMFRHGTVDGAGLVAVRVDVSQEFPYTEVANTTADTRRGDRAAEAAVDYGSGIGL